METRPSCIALAGPNGAGKSTAGPPLLRETLGVTEFVNADVIAQGLSAFEPEGVAIAAGRIMLARLNGLAAARMTFAFETTLAGRSLAPWLARLIATGYAFHIVFLWLPSAEFAVERVRLRRRLGGHAVPEATVRRRYRAGLRNFFALYRPLAATWRIYDNSGHDRPRLVAYGTGGEPERVEDVLAWRRIQESRGEWNDGD